MKERKKVIILGGGLAGLSLACELVEKNIEVTIIEKNPFLGGRASNSHDHTMGDPIPIGPHIFLTSYQNLRRFFHKIGVHHAISWQKKIFIEVIRDGVHHAMRHTRFPPPLYMMPWIWKFPFMTFADKMSHWKFSARLIFSTRASLEKLDSLTASEYLRSLGVSKQAIDIYWRFITLSILNVPIELCSAAEFFLLFKSWAGFRNRRIGFANAGLGDIYVHAAERYITERGGVVIKNVHATRIEPTRDNSVNVTLIHGDKTHTMHADAVVSTLTPHALLQVVPSRFHDLPYFKKLRGFKPVPYFSVHLWFDRKVTEKQFWALVDGPGRKKYLNTDFYDQSNIYATRSERSYITSNVIDSARFDHLSDSEIIERTLAELREVFPHMDAKLIHHHVHRIPYVIYAPHPGVRSLKPDHRAPIPNVYVAGDWTSRQVQCMETAVRSAYECAEVLLADLTIKRAPRILDFS